MQKKEAMQLNRHSADFFLQWSMGYLIGNFD
jgi:hypothetical protein